MYMLSIKRIGVKGLAIATIAVAIVAVAGWYWYMHTTTPVQQTQTAGVTEVTSGGPGGLFVINDTANPAPGARTAPAGFKEFSSQPFHFSLLFPQDLAVQVYQEQSGALTATFSDSTGEKQFQIFAISYNQTQITPERFKLDEPSGVRKEPVDVVIGGVRATSFFGNNAVMGDTREVWFINRGILYEVTTFKELDSWLAGIMQTWQFI